MVLLFSDSLYVCQIRWLVEEEELLLRCLRFCRWDLLINHLTKDRLTVEEEYKCHLMFSHVHGSFHRIEVKTQREARSRGLYAILTKSDELWKQDKGKGFVLLGAVNCEQVNLWGRPMDGKGYLIGLFVQTHLHAFPTPVIKVVFPFLI